jgi:hypothetical protein
MVHFVLASRVLRGIHRMPADRGSLVELLMGIVVIGGCSVALGVYLIRQAWGNFRDGRVPLAGSVHLTGIAARLGASLLLLAGAMVLLSGGAIAVLCLWRLPSLVAGE